MDVTNMLNSKGGSVVQHFHHQQFLPGHGHFQPPHHLSLIKHEPRMERSVSPHMSEHSSYSTHSIARQYPSPNAMQAPMHLPNSIAGQMTMPNYSDMNGAMGVVHNMAMHHHLPPQQQATPQPSKTFLCGTCSKCFARRSDLARHERIHTGLRPHVCDFRGCGKQFIQRSALTVHKRVHTGEKPHHCETCAKKFSDSSSLARHRRTHTGNRPYKCPYADCQKTFTRRTTLTRHQNHHSGTIEEAAAATAAALAASKAQKGGTRTRAHGDHVSSQGSPTTTTPSPSHRTLSISPSMELSATSNGANRHPADFQYLPQSGSLPPHLRGVGSPNATASNAYGNGMRPTSHPTSYGPPPILEPNLDQHQASSGSAGGSPHMTSLGWQSPSHMPSSSQNGTGYVYPEPDTYTHSASINHMYYGAPPQMRRPQNTEPGLVHMA